MENKIASFGLDRIEGPSDPSSDPARLGHSTEALTVHEHQTCERFSPNLVLTFTSGNDRRRGVSVTQPNTTGDCCPINKDRFLKQMEIGECPVALRKDYRIVSISRACVGFADASARAGVGKSG
jgi:hypothetical protein